MFTFSFSFWVLEANPAFADMTANLRSMGSRGAEKEFALDTLRADAGSTPDYFFYGLKRFREKFNLLLTLDRNEKAKLHYVIAERRLAEAAVVSGKNMSAMAKYALREYEREINETEKSIAALSRERKNITDVAGIVANGTYSHVFVLQKVYESAPEDEKSSVMHTVETSIEKQEKIFKEYEKREGGISRADSANLTVTVGNQTIVKEVDSRFAEKFREKEKELKKEMAEQEKKKEENQRAAEERKREKHGDGPEGG